MRPNALPFFNFILWITCYNKMQLFQLMKSCISTAVDRKMHNICAHVQYCEVSRHDLFQFIFNIFLNEKYFTYEMICEIRITACK